MVNVDAASIAIEVCCATTIMVGASNSWGDEDIEAPWGNTTEISHKNVIFSLARC